MLFGGVFAVHHFELLRPNHGTVTACQAHRLAAGLIDETHDVLLHFAAQNPFHHFHGFGIGHAHALNELAFLAQAVQRIFNLRPTAVNHHRVHAHELEQDDILRKISLQGRVCHGVAAVLDHQRFAMVFADIGQGLRQYLGFVTRGDIEYVVKGISHGETVKTAGTEVSASRQTN